MPNIITDAPYKLIFIYPNFLLKKKINTTNREIKVDTCPLPRWTLNN